MALAMLGGTLLTTAAAAQLPPAMPPGGAAAGAPGAQGPGAADIQAFSRGLGIRAAEAFARLPAHRQRLIARRCNVATACLEAVRRLGVQPTVFARGTMSCLNEPRCATLLKRLGANRAVAAAVPHIPGGLWNRIKLCKAEEPCVRRAVADERRRNPALDERLRPYNAGDVAAAAMVAAAVPAMSASGGATLAALGATLLTAGPDTTAEIVRLFLFK